MIWDLVYLDRVVHIPFSFFFFFKDALTEI